MDLCGPYGGIKNRDARRPASGEIKRGEASRTAPPRSMANLVGWKWERANPLVFMVIREIEKYLEYSSEFDITTLSRYTRYIYRYIPDIYIE